MASKRNLRDVSPAREERAPGTIGVSPLPKKKNARGRGRPKTVAGEAQCRNQNLVLK
jgi:hypothetical protein